MSSRTLSARCQRERKGSFFKLIDSFAWEIGTLKKEMVQKAEPAVKDPETEDALQGLSGEVGGLFMQAPPCGGMGVGLARARDSGYDSLRRRMSILDRLVQTHAVWLQLSLSHQDATRILHSRPAGTFLVRRSSCLQRKVISLRMDKDSEMTIKDFPVKESQYTFSLEGSGLSFADLFRLVAFCCISRDVLPFILKLPLIISSAKTAADLQEVAKFGAGFWDSELSRCRSKSSVSWSSETPAASRLPLRAQRLISTETASGHPRLQTRTPSELECCQSNGALCFINPLFIKVHHREPPPDPPQDQPISDSNNNNNPETNSACADGASSGQSGDTSSVLNVSSTASLQNLGGGTEPQEDTQNLGDNTQNLGDNTQNLGDNTQNLGDNTQNLGDNTQNLGDNTQNLGDNTQNLGDNTQNLGDGTEPQDNTLTGEPESQENLSHTQSLSRSPPPRPPPPRLTPRRPAPPRRQRSMPEMISWIILPKDKGEEREKAGEREKCGSLLSRLGSSLSLSSSSSSPPKRLSISSPICIPRPSLPRPLSSLSYSPRRPKPPPSDDAQCHLALEDQTIEKALSKARLSRQNTVADPEDSDSPRDPSLLTSVCQRQEVRGGRGGERGEECVRGQRLSDMSLSTDSSDSLDFSQSSAFFLPALHDPSPPTAAPLSLDFSQSSAFFLPVLHDPSPPTATPLSLPPSQQPYSSMEDEDDDEDEEEEPDYGVGLESDQDQDQDLTMVPPGHGTKRRASAGALLLQRALRGHLLKMSGVFHSLLTPEKRAVRRVLELSRNKGSYFGCLVQDYLSYLGEGGGVQAWQGHASGLELLQTLRQFLTQMKSYLRQSSELEPPIESLIPEDQIDQVLEKAMHKCVLKPLKAVVSAALQEFQVRSGAWQELKENLSLAKSKQPQEMGVADTLPPDPVAVEKIKHKFLTMCRLYSPEKKVTMLLRVCKLIYTIMEDNSGRLYGADDFLPMLTYVLAQCDLPQLDNEILYMMELLDPSLLHGEGGYYLTSAYGAMSLIRNFQEEQAARVLSGETRNTLHQWHRRRTTQRSAPSVDDFQNYLRVALQELDSGCTAKTLQVSPYATTEEVSRLCALKFKVSDPENYALFLLTEGSKQQLALDTHPQKIKAELHSRPQATPFHFVYRRVANLNGSTVNLNDLAVTSEPQANLNDLAVTSEPQANLNDHPAPSLPKTNLNLGLSPSLSLSLPPSQLSSSSISV